MHLAITKRGGISNSGWTRKSVSWCHGTSDEIGSWLVQSGERLLPIEIVPQNAAVAGSSCAVR